MNHLTLGKMQGMNNKDHIDGTHKYANDFNDGPFDSIIEGEDEEKYLSK